MLYREQQVTLAPIRAKAGARTWEKPRSQARLNGKITYKILKSIYLKGSIDPYLTTTH